MGPQWVGGGVSGHYFYMEARDDLADKLIQSETQESEEAAVRKSQGSVSGRGKQVQCPGATTVGRRLRSPG